MFLFWLIIYHIMKRQLFKDAGLQGTVLYQYQLRECFCSILTQGHWIVKHTHTLVSFINEVLSLVFTSREKKTLDCSLLHAFSSPVCSIFQNTCRQSFVCILFPD